MQAQLSERVLELVRNRGSLTLNDIQRATGVHPSLLSRFVRGQLKRISADDAQRLYEYLSGKRLDLN